MIGIMLIVFVCGLDALYYTCSVVFNTVIVMRRRKVLAKSAFTAIYSKLLSMSPCVIH